MKIYIVLLCSFIVSCLASAQPEEEIINSPLDAINPENFRIEMAKTIRVEDLKKHLEILASDDYEGRETGKPGNDRAAQYLAQQFKSIGLQAVDNDKSYLQGIDMVSERWEKIDFTVNGTEFRHLWDFYSPHEGNKGIEELKTDQVVFIGYGIQNNQIDNYKKTDVRGKTVLMYGGEPRDENGISLLTKDKTGSEWTTDVMRKVNLAKSKGAKHVFIIAEQFKQQIAQNRRFLIGPNVQLLPQNHAKTMDSDDDFRYAVISTKMAKTMVGKKLKKITKIRKKNAAGKSTKGIKVKSQISGHMIKRNQSNKTANVLGVLPGKHPTKKNEYIIVTAHFDHLGKRGDDIFNGADDNGSGTSTVLELAEAFATAAAFERAPDRSILFLLVSGEEKGLLGSKFYTDYPIIPLEKTMVNVNIDMVGRVDKQHEDPNYIYVIGADRLSTTLHEVNEQTNQTYEKLELDYKYNAEDDPNRYYYRSDHYNFAVKGIPAIFFFNGTHDDYHRPSDTVDKIDFDKMSKIGRHIFHLIWELGNREEPIEVNVR